MADMDRIAHVSTAASQCLAQWMEKIVPKVLYPREGRALESEKIVHLDSMH